MTHSESKLQNQVLAARLGFVTGDYDLSEYISKNLPMMISLTSRYRKQGNAS